MAEVARRKAALQAKAPGIRPPGSASGTAARSAGEGCTVAQLTVPALKHQYYSRAGAVTVEIYAKGLEKEAVHVTFTDFACSVSLPAADARVLAAAQSVDEKATSAGVVTP